MSVLNPNNISFSDSYNYTSGISQNRIRFVTLSRSNSSRLCDVTPIALFQVAYSAVGLNVPNNLQSEDSIYVLEAIENFLKSNGSVSINQKSLANLTLPEGLDTVWRVSMEVTSDRTSTGNITRLQLRSFKAILDYLGVNKPSDVLITISK